MNNNTVSRQSSLSAFALCHDPNAPGRWAGGAMPPNVSLGTGTIITGELAFKGLHSELPDALRVGRECTMDGVHFNVGRAGRLTVGDFCYFSNTVLLCEEAITVGNYVMIGWNVTVADTDFHPIGPAERVLDAIALSPLGSRRNRPNIETCPIRIEDDVWIGPNATILKGVTIGAGAWVEPGSLVSRDVPAGARILGNPARVIDSAQ
jgi:acetyltransferase-like isoleucine patch superfamily enzyme